MKKFMGLALTVALASVMAFPQTPASTTTQAAGNNMASTTSNTTSAKR